MKLVFVSNNANKLREVSAILPREIEIVSLANVAGDVDIEETAPTLEGNAEIKARYIWDNYKLNAFADDTGLEVYALDNAPGVHSARFAGPGKVDDDNMNKLLLELDKGQPRGARFRTVICLIVNGEPKFFDGIVEGEIASEKRGDHGFGYDPVFVPDGHESTFAEMTSEEKNSLSHRRRAVDSFADYIKENY
jgi:XTP/dITP diphosphohydrolase